VGPGQASRLVLTGDLVTGEEALRLGLVDLAVPRDQVVEKATELASAMARHDPVALAAAKRSLLAARGPGYAAGLAVEIDEFVRLHARPESRARIEAFLATPKR